MTAAQRRSRWSRPRKGGKAGPSPSFALFGEMLIVGVITLVFALPILTLPAALAAGVAHLRRHVGGFDGGIARTLRDVVRAAQQTWALGLILLVGALLVSFNLTVVAGSSLPGGSVVQWASIVASVAIAVLILRIAACWSDASGVRTEHTSMRAVIKAGSDAVWDDPSGSILLAAAAGAAAVLVWMLLPLALVVGGLLCLAATGVETRRH